MLSSTAPGAIPDRYHVTRRALILFLPLLLLLTAINVALLVTNTKQAHLQTEQAILNSLRLLKDASVVVEDSLVTELDEGLRLFLAEYSTHKGNIEQIDFTGLQQRLGNNVDLYAIDASGVVRHSTLTQDIGLDFRQWPDFFGFLEEIRQSGTLRIDAISKETRTGLFRKYAYLPTPDKRWILELGVKSEIIAQRLAPFDPLLVAQRLVADHPHLNQLRIIDRHGWQLSTTQPLQVEAEVFERVKQVLKTRQAQTIRSWNRILRYLPLPDSMDEHAFGLRMQVVELDYNLNRAMIGIGINLLFLLAAIVFTLRMSSGMKQTEDALHDAERRAQYQLTFHRIAAQTATALTTATSDAEFDSAINQCLQQLGLLFEADRSYVFQFSDDLAYATNTHEWCADGVSSEIDNLQHFPLENMSWLTTRLLRDGVFYARVASLPPETSAAKEEFQRQGVQSFLLATTHGAKGKLAGFIGFDSVREKRGWRDDELDMIQIIAEVVGSVSVNKRSERELRESEDKFRCIVNASPMGIHLYQLEEDGRLIFIGSNPAADKLLRTDNNAFIGLTIEEAFPPLLDSEVPERYRRAAREGESWHTEQINYNDKKLSGAFEVFAFQVSPGKIAVLFNEITERKQAQWALEQKNQEMEQFVYIVSHDLKSPLVTVKSFAGMLRQDLQNGDQQQINEDLNYINQAADKMQQLLDALLQYSRIGRVDSPAQTLSADKLVQDCLATLKGILQQHQVQVSTGDLSHQLHGDPLHFGQIWQNLLENAVKYRGDQALPQIEIGATQQGHDVVFYVRDNGMGIAYEHKERIFTLFSQLKPGSEGSGLGLALVKKIVSIYQGCIWVESAGEGHGSCFMFTLPGALRLKEGSE